MMPVPDTVFIVAAGGSSRRFGQGDKLFRMLDGIPVFVHCIRTVAPLLVPDRIVCAVNPDHKKQFEDAAAQFLPGIFVRFVPGGATRTESVIHALNEAASIPGAVYAAIHDAARPFMTEEMFLSCMDACRKYGGALLCRKIYDTVKRISPDGCCSETLDRDSLRGAETPQCFQIADLLTAYKKAMHSGKTFTDDAQIMEDFSSIRPFLVDHDGDNRKITIASDLQEKG